MTKIVEIQQTVARSVSHTTWDIPRIRDGDQLRNIINSDCVANSKSINDHDRFEDAVFKARKIMEQNGYKTKILTYQQYQLWCWK